MFHLFTCLHPLPPFMQVQWALQFMFHPHLLSITNPQLSIINPMLLVMPVIMALDMAMVSVVSMVVMEAVTVVVAVVVMKVVMVTVADMVTEATTVMVDMMMNVVKMVVIMAVMAVAVMVMAMVEVMEGQLFQYTNKKDQFQVSQMTLITQYLTIQKDDRKDKCPIMDGIHSQQASM